MFVFATGRSFDSSLFEQPLDILHTDLENSDGNISIARPSQKANTLFESGRHTCIMVSVMRLDVLRMCRKLTTTLYV